MLEKTRMKAKLKKVMLKNASTEVEVTEVKVIIQHPMKPANYKADNAVQAHFIEEITCEHNGEIVMSASWGAGVSTDPFFAFEFEGGKVGDLVKIAWRDNQGHTGGAVSKIK